MHVHMMRMIGFGSYILQLDNNNLVFLVLVEILCSFYLFYASKIEKNSSTTLRNFNLIWFASKKEYTRNS